MLEHDVLGQYGSYMSSSSTEIDIIKKTEDCLFHLSSLCPLIIYYPFFFSSLFCFLNFLSKVGRKKKIPFALSLSFYYPFVMITVSAGFFSPLYHPLGFSFSLSHM